MSEAGSPAHSGYLGAVVLCILSAALLTLPAGQSSAAAGSGPILPRYDPGRRIAPAAAVSADDPDRLAYFRLQGGVAGFDQEVEVQRDGTVSVRNRLRWRMGQLSPEDLGRLTALAQRVSTFTTGSLGPAGASDQVGESVTLYGAGQEQATDTEKNAVRTLVEGLANNPAATVPEGEEVAPGALSPAELAAALAAASAPQALPAGFTVRAVERLLGSQDTAGGARLDLDGPHGRQEIYYSVYYSSRAALQERRTGLFQEEVIVSAEGLPDGAFCKVSERTHMADCYVPIGSVLVSVDLGDYGGQPADAGVLATDAVALAQAAVAHLQEIQADR